MPPRLPAATALQMATLNGARALGLGDVTGSLAAGQARGPRGRRLVGVATQPVFDPVSHLVNAAGRGRVSPTSGSAALESWRTAG